MTPLEPATLQALKATPPTEVDGREVRVQFNPASLNISTANNISGAQKPSGPRAEHTGGASTLGLDLHFDTADEGTTDAPIDVRSRTNLVAQFVLPRAEGPATQAPPRVRFRWGTVIFDGVMTSMSEDLDLFSASGVPLRAKVTISIQNQDPRYESRTGRGAATAAGATAPGAGAFAAGAGLGVSAGFGASIGAGIGAPQLSLGGGSLGAGAGGAVGAGVPSVGVALDGESPAGFAARMGLDPAAWRGLASPDGIALPMAAGSEVAFARGAGSAPGVGSASGGGQPSAETVLELVEGPGSAPRAPQDVAAAGFAMTRAGGVDASLQTVRQRRADDASTQALHAFGLDRAAAPSSAHAAAAPRRALHAPPVAGMSRAAAPAPAPPPPHADARATTYGRGVPLRPRRAVGHADPTIPVVLARRAPASAPAPPLPAFHGGDCGCGCGGAP